MRHPKRDASPTAACPKVKDKELQAMITAAWRAGWWCEKTSSGHVKCFSVPTAESKGTVVTVANTPSDRRTVPNTRSTFRRAGLQIWQFADEYCGWIGCACGRPMIVEKIMTSLQTRDSRSAPLPKSEFQALLNIAPEPNSDEDLAAVAEIVLEAVCAEADGLALGPVVSVNLDDRTVVLEITVEAASASELHQKLGLISAALERGAPQLIYAGSSTSRSPQRELVPA